MALNAEIRFQYVRLMMTQMSLTPAEKSRWITANKLSLALGLLAAFGLLFVASFQVTDACTWCWKMAVFLFLSIALDIIMAIGSMELIFHKLGFSFDNLALYLNHNQS